MASARLAIAADIELVDDAADRTDRLDEAPERAEQSKEDKEAGQIAGNVTRLVETGGQRIEKGAHDLRRNGDTADPFAAEDRRHGREQRRRSGDRKPGIGAAERIDPGDFREQPDHPHEGQDNADQQNAENQAVQPGIGHEGVDDLALEHKADQTAQDEKNQHPDEKDTGRGELGRIGGGRHRPNAQSLSSIQYGIAAIEEKRMIIPYEVPL